MPARRIRLEVRLLEVSMNETGCVRIGLCNPFQLNYEVTTAMSRSYIYTAALGHEIGISDHSRISLASQLSLPVQPVET